MYIRKIYRNESAAYDRTWRDIRRVSSLGDIIFMIRGLVDEFKLTRTQFDRLVNSWAGNEQGVIGVFRNIPKGTVPAGENELAAVIRQYRGKLSNAHGKDMLSTAEALVRKAAYEPNFLPASTVLGLALMISKEWPDSSGGASRGYRNAWTSKFDIDDPSQEDNWRARPYRCAFK